MKIVLFILVLFAVGIAIINCCTSTAIKRHFGAGLVLAFFTVTVSGALLHNPLIHFSICFCAFFILLKSRDELAPRFLLMSVLTVNFSFQASLGSVYILDIHPTLIYTFALIIGSWIFPSKEPNRFCIMSEDLVVAALMFIAVVSQAREPTATSLIRQILTPILGLSIPYLYLTRCLTNRVQLRSFFGVIAGGALILAVFSLYEAKGGWSLFDTYWHNFDSENFMSRNLRVRAGLLRTPTTFNESTSFAVFEVVGVIAAVYSRNLFRSISAWIFCCGLVSVALLAAQSRGALVALAAAFAIIFLLKRAFVRASLVIGITGGAVASLLAIAKFNKKAASFVNADQALVGQDYRQKLLASGFQEGMNHFWIGQGRDQVTAKLDSLVQGEHMVDFVNTYLTFFLGSGIIGFLAFLIPLALVFKKLWSRRDLRRRDEAARGVEYVVGALTAVLVALIFTSFYERNPLWLIVTLAASKVLTRIVPPRPNVLSQELSTAQGVDIGAIRASVGTVGVA